MHYSVQKYTKYLTACAGSGNRNKLRFDWWYQDAFFISIAGEVIEIDYPDLRLIMALEGAAREFTGADMLYEAYYGKICGS